MKVFVQKNWLPASIALLLLFVTINFGDFIQRQWTAYTPAVDWRGVEVVTQTVEPGGVLRMNYEAIINKACPADVRSFVVAPDNTVPVRFPVVAGGYSKPSGGEPVKISVAVTLPRSPDPGLAPFVKGRHIYRTIVTRYCPDGIEEDTAVPDAAFDLEVP